MATANTFDIGKCGNDHDLMIYCSNCNCFFCGKCSTLAHSLKGAFKDHDVELIQNFLKIETRKGDLLIEELKRLSESAEATAIAKEEAVNDLSEILKDFIAQVNQNLSINQIIHDAQSLRKLYRESVSLIESDFDKNLDVKPINSIDALYSQLTKNALCQKQLDKIAGAMHDASGEHALKMNVFEAITKVLISLTGQEYFEGFRIHF